MDKVYMIWDLYDGPRSGIANLNGAPHYFSCTLSKEGGYTEEFELFPIEQGLLLLATEQWSIYRRWEIKFHTGKVSHETHPGNRGQDAHYDELENKIKMEINKLYKLPSLFLAKFKVLSGQSHLPDGVLRSMEVEWVKVT